MRRTLRRTCSRRWKTAARRRAAATTPPGCSSTTSAPALCPLQQAQGGGGGLGGKMEKTEEMEVDKVEKKEDGTVKLLNGLAMVSFKCQRDETAPDESGMCFLYEPTALGQGHLEEDGYNAVFIDGGALAHA